MVIHGHPRPFMVFHCRSILGACKSWREQGDHVAGLDWMIDGFLSFDFYHRPSDLFVWWWVDQINHSLSGSGTEQEVVLFVYVFALPPSKRWVHIAVSANLPITTKDQSVTDISQTDLFDRIQEKRSHYYYKTNKRLRRAFSASLWKSAMLVDGVGW